eukprot:1160262-Pelagomonas_calceolata.AAC.2
MLRTPDVGQDKKRARRWPIGARPTLPALVRLSTVPKSDKHQALATAQNLLQIITSSLLTHSLLQFGPEQGPSQKWHLPGVTEKCRHRAHREP